VSLKNDLFSTFVKQEAVPLNELIQEILDDVSLLLTKRKLEINHDASTRVTLRADQDKLKQIIMNLVLNAVRFTPDGGRIQIKLEKGKDVRVSVKDTGIGVKKEEGTDILTTGEGLNIFATKNMKTWRSVWTLLPLSREQMTNLCDYAGVHVYSRNGELLLANNSYLVVHTQKGATQLDLELPGEKEVYDCVGKKNLGVIKKIQEQFIAPGITKIYRTK
jgi:hypothetical protein